MIIDIDHVRIAAPPGSEAQARHLFGAVLGLPELPKPSLQGPGGCWFQLGPHQLHVGIDPDFRAAGKAHVAVAATGRAVVAGGGGSGHALFSQVGKYWMATGSNGHIAAYALLWHANMGMNVRATDIVLPTTLPTRTSPKAGNSLALPAWLATSFVVDILAARQIVARLSVHAPEA